MAKPYDTWVLRLLDDFWEVFYPGIPRAGNATESKCRNIEREITKGISASSLYNYFNEKGSPPTDGTKGIMSYYVLLKWKEAEPTFLEGVDLEAGVKNLSRNELASRYLMTYHRHKGVFEEKEEEVVVMDSSKEELLGDMKRLSVWALLAVSFIAGILYFLGNSKSGDQGLMDALSANSLIQSTDDLFFIAVLHVLTIMLLFGVYYFLPTGGRAYIHQLRHGNTKEAMLQFQTGWIGILTAWGLLYTWMCYKWSLEQQLLEAGNFEGYAQFVPWSWAVADMFSLLSTLCFFFIFFVLDIKTGKGRTALLEQRMIAILILGTVILAFSLADRFLFFGAWEGTGTLVYSILTSISMLYFFGRLDSHLFNANRWLLAPLYLYAVIQVNWTNLQSADFALQGLAIFFLAFLLKIYLFFLISGWIRSGDFEVYFENIRKIERRND